MGFGDSITEGADYFTSYIFPLWEKLMSAGYEFDFIGPRETKCRIGTLKCGGYSGHTVEFLDSKVDSLYRLYPADIVLLHAGHNHSVEENPVPHMIASYRSIIEKIWKINPQAFVLLAKVIPSGKLPKYSYIPELNKQIERLVKEIHSDHLICVDQAAGFDWKTETVKDKVHPNAKGAEKMASVWFSSLQKVLKPAPNAFHPEIIKYKDLPGNDSLSIHLFRPAGNAGDGKNPAIVYFFGGGWTNGTPLQFYRECAYFASKGYVAISADYRIRSLYHSSIFDSFEDAKDVIRFIRGHADELRIDADRIAVAGASAGGHLAASLGTIGTTDSLKADYLPNLMLLYYPVVDVRPERFPALLSPDSAKAISPLYHVSRNTPPALFLLGTEDPIVPVGTAKAFQEKMLRKGVPCELDLFEGAGHPIFQYRKPLTKEYGEILDLSEGWLERL